MATRRPVTDEERQQVTDLHRQGLGRNDIARRLGRSAGLVTKVAAESGLSFDRAPTAVAVEAKRRTAAERRADLALKLLDDAERLRAQLWQPHTAYSFGGRDNTYAEHPVCEPPPADKGHLMRAASTAIDKSLRLDEYDRDGGTDAARSMLGNLFTVLAVQHAADTADTATTP